MAKYTKWPEYWMKNTNYLPAGRAFIGEIDHLLWLFDQLWLTYKSSCPPPISREGEIRQLIILLISQQQRCKELYNRAIVDLGSWEAIQDIAPFNEILEND